MLLLLAQLASTWFMVGLIWFVQIVHYPLFGQVGADGFTAYEQLHQQRTGYVVIPPMVIELVTAFALLSFRPTPIPRWMVLLGAVLVAVVWLSTAILQAPYHGQLSGGYDSTIHYRLVATNWIRTVAWSLRGLLVLWMVERVITHSSATFARA